VLIKRVMLDDCLIIAIPLPERQTREETKDNAGTQRNKHRSSRKASDPCRPYHLPLHSIVFWTVPPPLVLSCLFRAGLAGMQKGHGTGQGYVRDIPGYPSIFCPGQTSRAFKVQSQGTDSIALSRGGPLLHRLGEKRRSLGSFRRGFLGSGLFLQF
jgi:hypothetical protein